MRSESAARETVNCDARIPDGTSGFARIVFPWPPQYRMPKLTSRREYFRLPYPVTSGATLVDRRH